MARCVLPKVYNGKDKTFFMFNMEWIRNASPLPYTASYPTAAERTGDFSSLVNATGAAGHHLRPADHHSHQRPVPPPAVRRQHHSRRTASTRSARR